MWCKGCLATILLLMVAGLMAAALVFWNLGDFLDATQPIDEVDAIMVMGGEGGRYQRTQHAITLYEEGVAPVVVFSGGTLLSAGIACSSTDMSVDAAGLLGLPPEAVLISGEAQSTLDEAENASLMASEHGWQSVALVTDRFHTRRSLATMQNYMPGTLVVASAPDDPRFVTDRWWSTEDGLTFAINETLKLAFYWKNYGIRPF